MPDRYCRDKKFKSFERHVWNFYGDKEFFKKNKKRLKNRKRYPHVLQSFGEFLLMKKEGERLAWN